MVDIGPSTSETALCNRALTALGHNARLTSFADDEGATADACRAAFWDAWQEELIAYPWNRATRRVSLAALATAPGFEFSNQFQLPADCLKVQGIYGAGQYDRWRVELYYPGDDPAQAAEVILTDIAAPLPVIYTPYVRDFTRVGPAFRGAFVLRLAVHLAGPITRDDAKTMRMIEVYKEQVQPFRVADAQERGAEAPAPGEWLTARDEAGGWDLSPYRGV